MHVTGCLVMASHALSPTQHSQHRHKPAPVDIPNTVATEAEEGQTGANSLLAAQASDRLAARQTEVVAHSCAHVSLLCWLGMALQLSLTDAALLDCPPLLPQMACSAP